MAETDVVDNRNSVRWHVSRCCAVAIVMVAILSSVLPAQTVLPQATSDDLELAIEPPRSNIPTATIPTEAIPTEAIPTEAISIAAIPAAAQASDPRGHAVRQKTDPPRPESPKEKDATPTWLDSPVENSWTSPSGFSRTLQTALGLSVLSLAPAILLMTTSFVRISVVLGLLRQSLGTQAVPSNQVITSLALFMTILIMTPVWQQVYTEAIEPYTNPDVDMQWQDAWALGVAPVRDFMSHQIDIADNGQDIWLFYEYLPEDTPEPKTYADIPLQVLLPAFLLSELKTAFLIGFRIYLPFLIVDLVVSSVTTSMGMMMLPPMMISLPLKLMLFVLVDGWHLVVGMLLQSFGTIGL